MTKKTKPYKRHKTNSLRKKRFFMIFLLVSIVICGTGLLYAIYLFVRQPSPSSHVLGLSTMSTAIGIPAISPTQKGKVSPGKATFTLSDAKTFIHAHPFQGGEIVNGFTPTITSLMFTTSRDVSSLVEGEQTGLHDSVPVLFVKQKGPFVFSNMPIPKGDTVPTYPYVVEVFDGLTGNLVLEGGELQ